MEKKKSNLGEYFSVVVLSLVIIGAVYYGVSTEKYSFSYWVSWLVVILGLIAIIRQILWMREKKNISQEEIDKKISHGYGMIFTYFVLLALGYIAVGVISKSSDVIFSGIITALVLIVVLILWKKKREKIS